MVEAVLRTGADGVLLMMLARGRVFGRAVQGGGNGRVLLKFVVVVVKVSMFVSQL